MPSRNARRSTSWDAPLWVNIYTVDGDSRGVTRSHIDSLASSEFSDVEKFLAAEARRHGVDLDQPFRLRIVGEYRGGLPTLAPDAGALGTLFGVCANELAVDGHVVESEYGCGAHSDTPRPPGTGSPLFDPFDDGVLDVVEPES